jgi:hypothetical protein
VIPHLELTFEAERVRSGRAASASSVGVSYGSRGEWGVFLRAFLVVLCLLEGRVYLELDGLWCDSYAWSYGQGPDEVESTLEAMFETGSNNHVFDTTPNGLDVDMTVSLLNLKDLGAFALVTLDLVVTGRGIHVFQEEASAVLSYQKSG